MWPQSARPARLSGALKAPIGIRQSAISNRQSATGLRSGGSERVALTGQRFSPRFGVRLPGLICTSTGSRGVRPGLRARALVTPTRTEVSMRLLRSLALTLFSLILTAPFAFGFSPVAGRHGMVASSEPRQRGRRGDPAGGRQRRGRRGGGGIRPGGHLSLCRQHRRRRIHAGSPGHRRGRVGGLPRAGAGRGLAQHVPGRAGQSDSRRQPGGRAGRGRSRHGRGLGAGGGEVRQAGAGARDGSGHSPGVGWLSRSATRWPRICAAKAASWGSSTESRHIFLRDGKYYEPGEIFRQPELARTLRAIAKQGPEAFYRGAIARQIAGRRMEKNHGLITPGRSGALPGQDARAAWWAISAATRF